MILNANEIDMIRQVADGAAGLVVAFGLPWLGAWAVRKGLIQQRWVTVIDAAAAAGLAAGNATGKPIDAPEFRKAAEAALLAYVQSQAADIIKAKAMTDNQVIEAGMARASKLTSAAIGPNGSAAGAPLGASKISVSTGGAQAANAS